MGIGVFWKVNIKKILLRHGSGAWGLTSSSPLPPGLSGRGIHLPGKRWGTATHPFPRPLPLTATFSNKKTHNRAKKKPTPPKSPNRTPLLMAGEEQREKKPSPSIIAPKVLPLFPNYFSALFSFRSRLQAWGIFISISFVNPNLSSFSQASEGEKGTTFSSRVNFFAALFSSWCLSTFVEFNFVFAEKISLFLLFFFGGFWRWFRYFWEIWVGRGRHSRNGWNWSVSGVASIGLLGSPIGSRRSKPCLVDRCTPLLITSGGTVNY